MPAKSVKIAVSLPAPLYRSVEAARKRYRRSRSTVVQNALAEWLRSEREAELVRRYEEGYRRRAVTKRELDAANASAVEVLGAVEW